MTKKLYSIIILIILITIQYPILTQTVQADEPVQVYLTCPATKEVGSSFDVYIMIDDVEDFDAANYDISFNDSLVSYNGASNGDIDGNVIPYSYADLIDIDTIRVIQNYPGINGATGSGYLISLHFTGIASGINDFISSNAVLSNATAMEIPVEWSNCSVELTSPIIPSVFVNLTCQPSVYIGDVFDVYVMIDDVVDFDAANFDISFNDSLVSYNGASNGIIGGNELPTPSSGLVDSDTVRIVVNSPGVTGLSGSGYFVILHFTAINSGICEFIPSNSILSNVSAEEIPAIWKSCSIDTSEIISTLIFVNLTCQSSVYIGDVFDVYVMIDDVVDFDAADYIITYDSTKIDAISISNGDIGGTTIPASMSSPTSNSRIIVNNIPGTSGATGSGYLAAIHFSAISAGFSNINISSGILSNTTADPIICEWNNATINVLINTAPTIITSDVTTSFEDLLYAVDYEATDPDIGDMLTWSLDTDAGFLSIDTSSGILSGTPLNNDVGSYYVNVSVDDGNGGMDFSNFTLIVSNTNDPPLITTIDITTTDEDALYSVDYEATDVDVGDVLTWNLITNAGFLGIDSSSGILSGIPDNGDVGFYLVNVSIADGNGGEDWHNFTLEVVNTNDPPTIITIDDTDADEDVLYSVDYDATDPDVGDTLTWSLTTDAGFLSIDSGSGILSGIPVNDDVGSYYVNVSVDDGNWGMDFSNFTLIVSNINDPPIITTADVATATEDYSYSVDYDATDPDVGDTLTWSLSTNASFLSISSEHGILFGTPLEDDAGSFYVNVSVNDDHAAYDYHNFTLTVIAENDPPIVSDIPNQTINEGDSFSLIYLDDYVIDIEDNDTAIMWSSSGETNLLVTIINRIATITTPSNDWYGTEIITFTARDTGGLTDENSATFKVLPQNDNPEITTSDVVIADEDELYSVDYEATDPDVGDTLTWDLATDAGFLSIDMNSGLLIGVPKNADVGSYYVNVSVDDGNWGMDFSNFSLTVININDPPEIITTDEIVAVEDILYQVDYDAKEVDIGNILNWSLQTNADFLSINNTTGLLNGTPDKTDIGSFYVNISVDDGNGEIDYSNFTLTVQQKPIPDDPVSPGSGTPGGGNPIPPPVENKKPIADGSKGEPYTGFVGESIIFDGSLSYDPDEDGSIMKWVWNFGDGTNSTGEIVSHVYTSTGNYTVSLTVWDDKDAECTEKYITTIEIRKANIPPTTPTITGPSNGTIENNYTYSIICFDEDDEIIQYHVSWGDGSTIEIYNTSQGEMLTIQHAWKSGGIYDITIHAFDGSTDSESSIKKVLINVYYINNIIKGYLFDHNDDGIYETFEDETTGKTITVKNGDAGIYFIDMNEDGSFEYRFNTDENTLQVIDMEPDKAPSLSVITLLIVLIIEIIIILFVIMIKQNKSGRYAK